MKTILSEVHENANFHCNGNCPLALVLFLRFEALTCFDTAVRMHNTEAMNMRESVLEKIDIYYPETFLGEEDRAELVRYGFF